MIVEARGEAKRVFVATARLQALASTSGTAYRKTTIVKTIIRVIKKWVKVINKKFIQFVYVVKPFLATRTGKPTSIDPPLTSRLS